jgi:cytochrome c oxidase assembly factor 5
MSSSCEALLAALKDCLLHSDCVLKQGFLPSQCLKEHMNELPEECRSLRKATFECKRGMVGVSYRLVDRTLTPDYYFL